MRSRHGVLCTAPPGSDERRAAPCSGRRVGRYLARKSAAVSQGSPHDPNVASELYAGHGAGMELKLQMVVARKQCCVHLPVSSSPRWYRCPRVVNNLPQCGMVGIGAEIQKGDPSDPERGDILP